MNIMGRSVHPAVPLKRDEALAFIIGYIVEHGFSPLQEEVAQELKVSQPRARELLQQLVKIGSIEIVAGAPRGIRVRDLANCRVHLGEACRRLGWEVASAMGELQQPFSHNKLPRAPRIEDDSDIA